MTTHSLKITYNPFTVVSQFTLNDELVRTGNLIEASKNRRLQQWIDKIFTPLFEDLNSRKIDIYFEGTRLDAIDVKDAICQFKTDNPDFQINEDYSACRDLSAEDKLEQLKALFNKAQEGPFEEFRSKDMHRAFNKAIAPEFEATVLATMSAGKSTVINAMLGMELMPSKNEACTATISKIYDHDDMPHFEAKRTGHDGEQFSDWVKADLKLIEEWNSSPDTSLIEIKGNIPTIQERAGIKLVLVDTPGPNNSRDESHRASTIKAIRGKQPSMVLYILNATQLSTDDDKELLDLINEAMAEGGREAQDRFIFIANKIDNFDPEKGESISGALNNVKQYLKVNGLDNPLIIPASAELAKLLRMAEYGGIDSLSRKQKGSLTSFIDLFIEEQDMNMLEHAKDSVDLHIYRALNSKLSNHRADKNNEKIAEILSGIPIIESLLNNYITKHALPSRIKDAVDTFKTIDATTRASEKVNEIIKQSKDELKEIVKLINLFRNSEERIGKAKEFKNSLIEMEFSQSKNSLSVRKSIDIEVNILLDSFVDDFTKNDVSPSEAERKFAKAEHKASSLICKIQEILFEDLQNEMDITLTGLRDDYQKYVKDLLERAFPDSKSMHLLKDFESSSLEMPDLKPLIQGATYEKQHKEWVGTERHGFLWLKKRDIYKTTYEDLVNMKEPAETLMQSLREAKSENFKESQKIAKQNFNLAKQTLLEQMNEIDEKLKKTLEDINKANNDHDYQNKMIAINEEKISWYKNFILELDAILAI